MKVPEVEKKILLEGTCPSWEEAGTVMLGLPVESTSSYRPGSRFGPEAIRSVFWESLEDYSLYCEEDFTSTSLFDWGDARLSRGNIDREIEESRGAVEKIIRDDKTPLVLGGEHTVTVAAVGGLLGHYPEMEVVQLDAHADLRPGYQGEKLSHASTAYRLLDLGVGSIHQLGIRSCTREERSLAGEKTRFYPFRVFEPLQKITSGMGNTPVYVTLDIDVVDPAYAPGTGTPEPGGISSAELLESLQLLSNLNLVGFDLVEVSPPYDSSGITSILGAKILREMAIILNNCKKF